MRMNGQSILSEIRDQGFSIVPDVLTRETATALTAKLWGAAEKLTARGTAVFMPDIDQNASNVRIFDLPEHDPAFTELLTRPEICSLVAEALGGDIVLSNFTANIARPGARPMKVHSDQALSLPEPWLESWVLNVIWCLDDICAANGATRYVPGSHKFQRMEELPGDIEGASRPFEASAGSIIFMDGRLWHSSGSNVTADSDRPLLFGYYARAFIRPQVNWHEALSPEVIAALDARQRQLFGFGQFANSHGLQLVLQDSPR